MVSETCSPRSQARQSVKRANHLPFTADRLPLSASLFLAAAVDGEVRVGVDARLVGFDHLCALGLGQLAALDALRDEAAEALVQLPARAARAVERLADGRALHDLLDEVAVLVNVYVRLVGRAEEVVVVAHPLLVSAHEHEGYVVGLALYE